MKDFWNKHRKKLLVGAAFLILFDVVVWLYKLGFRITYAPELETSWDAVSAFASWAGVIMSFIAVIFAIWVPIRIADRQDKIALFEKRYELYELLYRWWVIFEQALLYAENNNDVRQLYNILYDSECAEDKEVSNSMISMYRRTMSEISKTMLLFPVSGKSCGNLMKFVNMVHKILIGNELIKNREKIKIFVEENAIEQIFKQMEKEMSICK